MCPLSEIDVTPSPAALRQRRYREGTAHAACLARKRELRRARKEKWQAARREYKTIRFDGKESGPLRDVGPLSEFGKRDPELRGI